MQHPSSDAINTQCPVPTTSSVVGCGMSQTPCHSHKLFIAPGTLPLRLVGLILASRNPGARTKRPVEKCHQLGVQVTQRGGGSTVFLGYRADLGVCMQPGSANIRQTKQALTKSPFHCTAYLSNRRPFIFIIAQQATSGSVNPRSLIFLSGHEPLPEIETLSWVSCGVY